MEHFKSSESEEDHSTLLCYFFATGFQLFEKQIKMLTIKRSIGEMISTNVLFTSGNVPMVMIFFSHYQSSHHPPPPSQLVLPLE